MRILVIIYEFPPIGGGGGQAAQDVCIQLARQGHDLRVLTSHYGDLPRQETQHGFEVLRIPALRKLPYRAPLSTMAAYVLSGSWHGLGQVRRWKPDLLHVHFAVPCGPVAWLLSKFSGIPYVLTAHLGDVPGGVPEKTGAWFRWIAPLTPPIWNGAAGVVAVSEYTRQLALQRYRTPIQVIPNGVDLEALDPGEMQVNQPPRIAFAGRFMPQKNLLQVVRSLAEVRDLPWECTLLGDGPQRPEIEQEIQRQGLADRFHLPGWVTPAEVSACFQTSDLLFMPSTSEGLSVVGVQALALGLAMVVSKIGGFMDLVTPGENGYLVDLQSPDEFATRLRELLTDPNRLLAFRQASRRKAQEFDIRKVAAAYESLFNKVLFTDHVLEPDR